MAEFRKKRKKICHMCAGKPVNYKDVAIISKYINDNGKILPRRFTSQSDGLFLINQLFPFSNT